jgi:hypothetical protein
MNLAVDAADILQTAEGALIAGAIPAFALLTAPLYLERLLGAARSILPRRFVWQGR